MPNASSAQPVNVEGVVPVIPTPFRKDDSIDYEALAASVRFAAKVGLSAICLPAYGSEFYKLSDAERGKVVETAVTAADGRVRVIGQSNHVAAACAVEIAKANEARGADLISFALPRVFALRESDLLSYARTICSAVSVPVMIQDFNPGGVTIGSDFCRALAEACPNFRYAKLEEPMLGPKLLAIREATDDRVGILEGWGGMYMMELIEPGICGLIPGLGMGDLMQLVWRSAKAGDDDEAFELFSQLLPHIVYSLQSMELYLWMDKDLLARRGIIPADSAHVRSATLTPDDATWRYAQKLNQRVVDLANQRVS